MCLRYKLFCVTIIALQLFVISGCGSKRNPTGGAQDTVKPQVLGSSPAEYAQIENGLLEISFSKPMDKASVTNSIYIYPPVQNKKISLEGANLKIKLLEPLQANTNYFVTLSTRLKDSRGNPLEKNQSLIFRNGELHTHRIAGTISYEQPSDLGSPLELSLFSPDSLLVYSDRITGGAYALDALNPQAHILRAYIDKNLNGRYDFGTEPWFEGKSDGSKVANLNVEMAYGDSSLPKINRIVVVSNRELQIQLSEKIDKYRALVIMGKQALPIAHQLLEGDKISVLCAPMDSTEYTLQLLGAQDLKTNTADLLEQKFRGKARPDTLAPVLSYSNPRNGASVNSLSPVLELHFSKIMPANQVQVKLYAGNEEIMLKQLSSTGRIHKFQPIKELVNYKSHILKVLSSTKDFNGNSLEKDYELQFLPLKRN